MAANVYGNFPLRLVKGELDFDTAVIKAMLVGSSYSLDVDNHDYKSDVDAISGAELTGTGYTAGGITLTNVVTSYDSANNRVKIDADDAAFGTLTMSGITGLITYVDTGVAATSALISYHSFTSQSPAAVTFTYQWHANGILTLSV